MSFNQSDALLMAKMSRTMYRTDNTFNNYFTDGRFIQNEWTRCVVGFVEEIDNLVIAFRGSSTLNEWISNCDSSPSFELAHSGFISTTDAIWVAFKDFIGRLVKQYRGKQIIFTGHSRGGALAVLMAIYAENADLPVDKIYTFGSPRVISEFTSVQYNLKHFRVENKQDPVSVLPWCFQYKHTGKLVLLSNTSCKATVYNQGRNPLKRAIDLVDSQIIKAHNIDSYIDILEGNCGVTTSGSPPPDSEDTFSFACITKPSIDYAYIDEEVVVRRGLAGRIPLDNVGG
ncbi:MAG: lipase family protein [Cyanobacteria bacterium]|nr:lipase family protein [Cyanobacteriota bacterium]